MLAFILDWRILHTAGTKRGSVDTGVQGGEGGRHSELA